MLNVLPPFQRCQVYDWPLFCNKKYTEGPTFSDFSVYAEIFHSELSEAACSLGVQ